MTDLMFPKIPKREYPETEERGYLNAKQKIALVEAQGKRCKLCGCTPSRFEFDHIQELSLGGTNDPDNWQALCRDCHSTKSKGGAAERKIMRRKRDKTSQWAKRQKKQPWAKVTAGGSVKVKQS